MKLSLGVTIQAMATQTSYVADEGSSSVRARRLGILFRQVIGNKPRRCQYTNERISVGQRCKSRSTWRRYYTPEKCKRDRSHPRFFGAYRRPVCGETHADGGQVEPMNRDRLRLPAGENFGIEFSAVGNSVVRARRDDAMQLAPWCLTTCMPRAKGV